MSVNRSLGVGWTIFRRRPSGYGRTRAIALAMAREQASFSLLPAGRFGAKKAGARKVKRYRWKYNTSKVKFQSK